MNSSRELEERFIEFSVGIISVTEKIKPTTAGYILKKQIIRSGTSATLNYSEAIAGESRKDFIHKMRISLKELRETHTCIKILRKSDLFRKGEVIIMLENECDQLISILVKSIMTALKNS